MRAFINSVATVIVMTLWAGMLSLIPAERASGAAEGETLAPRESSLTRPGGSRPRDSKP